MLEADGYQPYLISPEKGLRSLIKQVLEMAKEPSRLCVDEVRFCVHLLLLHNIYVYALKWYKERKLSRPVTMARDTEHRLLLSVSYIQ